MRYGVKSESLLDTGNSAPNAVVKRSVFITSVVQNVCLYYGLRVCGKKTCVTVCEKVVPRLNEHDGVIEWNFMKIAPPKWRAGCARLQCMLQAWIQTESAAWKVIEQKKYCYQVNSFQQIVSNMQLKIRWEAKIKAFGFFVMSQLLG